MPTYETEMKGSGIKGARYETQSNFEKDKEIERLKEANARGQEYSQQLFDENERLKAELQRLTGPIQHID